MLCLKLYIGGDVFIGDFDAFQVTKCFAGDCITIKHNEDTRTIPLQRWKVIGPGRIMVSWIGLNSCKITFDYPREVKILRGELLDDRA